MTRWPLVALAALAALAASACGKKRPAASRAADGGVGVAVSAGHDASFASGVEQIEAAFPPDSRVGPPTAPHGLRVDGDGRIHLPALPRFVAFQTLVDAWGPSSFESFQQDVLHQTVWAASDGATCAIMDEDPAIQDDDAPRWANVRFVPCATLPAEQWRVRQE